MPERTLPQLFEDSVAAFPSNVLLWEKSGAPTGARPTRKCGPSSTASPPAWPPRPGRGERAALISEGRNDWVMGELGILYTGAINVPISVKIDELSDLKFRLPHSGSKLAIVSKSQVAKIRQIKSDLPELERTIVLDEMPSFEADEISAATSSAGARNISGRTGRSSRGPGGPSGRTTPPTSATRPARRPTPRASS